jgi:hypothetical protein
MSAEGQKQFLMLLTGFREKLLTEDNCSYM